jgi:hypothetical protein
MLASDIFTIVSSALIQTGNQPPTASFDGTDEWVAGQNAYELWLPYCLEAYDWTFQRTQGQLTRIGGSSYPGFSDTYQYPPGCLHLISVMRADVTAPVGDPWGQPTQAGLYPLQYKIIRNSIATNAPNGLAAEWITDVSGSDQYSATFTAALIGFVASSLYASLNEDLVSAETTYKMAEAMLGKAAGRVKEQQSRRTPLMASPLSGDAFTTISSALIQVGAQPPATAWDGTDDWIDGWNAYSIWLPYCLEARDWNFQTAVLPLVRVGDATYPRFSDAYAMPPDCLHLQTVWRPDLAGQMPGYMGWGMTEGSIRPPQIEYRIIGGVIETSAPFGLTAKYLTVPAGADAYSATFNLALSAFVASSLYASRNKDGKSAEAMKAHAMQLLEEAASRTDAQENRRVAFRSRMLERRRARYAPWGSPL